MNTSLERQLINATIAASCGKGQPKWVVRSKYAIGDELSNSRLMTYREAKAIARSIRMNGGFAIVERA